MVLLLLAGGIVFALLGWRVLDLEQTAREQRAMRDAGLAVARGKADADRLARGPRGRPDTSWRVEDLAGAGAGIRADESVYRKQLVAAAEHADPKDALAAYERLLHPELPTWVQDIAALRSGVLLWRSPRHEEALRRLSRAAAASPLLVDISRESVRFAALRYLVLDGMGRRDAAALRRLLDEAEDGGRLATRDVVGPARTLVTVAASLERTLWGREENPERRRLLRARDRAREGLRMLAEVPTPGTALVGDRVVVHGSGRLAVFGLDALRQPDLPGLEREFDLVIVSRRDATPPGALRLEEPLGSVAVVPRRVRPLADFGTWLLVALGIGLLAYVVGAAAAIAGWRRSARVAAQQAHFTAAVSHEMKTPIASVRAMAGLLTDDGPQDPARVRLYGERIDGEMQRLGATVRNVLDAAHIERGTLPVHPEPGDPAAFLHRVVQGMQPALEARGFTLRCHAEPAEGPVPFDAQALEGVLLNLLDNAAKFSTEQRVIEVQGEPRPRGGYRMLVQDRGVGLGSGDTETLFERYNRGAAAREGAVPGVGLGLHIAREVVEAHGGRLRARNRPGGGAVFEIDLPGDRRA